MVRLTKGGLIGTLKVTEHEHYTAAGCNRSQCLAVLDDSGNWLSSTWFKTTSEKMALQHFLDNGWQVIYSKMEAYKTGNYKFKCPGVTTARWNDQDWINYIDAYNGWTVPTE